MNEQSPLVARARQLAVPPMHKSTSRADRVRVYELVLRRQFGLAWDTANFLEADRLRALKKKREQSAEVVQSQYTDAKARLDGWLDAA